MQLKNNYKDVFNALKNKLKTLNAAKNLIEAYGNTNVDPHDSNS